MNMNKISRIAIVSLVILLPAVIYYAVTAISWTLNNSFFMPELWLRDPWVHPNAAIAWQTRFVFFVVWIIPPLSGIYGYVMGGRVLWLFFKGIVFDARVAKAIIGTGVGTALAATSQLFAAALSPMIKSWHNPGGHLPLRFWYDSETVGLIFCGLGFFVLGLVMMEAIKVAQENERFV